MTAPLPDIPKFAIRPVQYRDLEFIETLMVQEDEATDSDQSSFLAQQFLKARHWYGLLKLLSLFPNPFRYQFCAYVAESQIGRELLGFIQVAPFNRTRSTWRVKQVSVPTVGSELSQGIDPKQIGSQLLRYCFETLWEARTWILEVGANEKDSLALYRQNGFQPLAHLTYWSLPTALLAELAAAEPNLPNLLPVSNADAQLLYQLDCVSMPPLLRQVFDRHIQDFSTNFFRSLSNKIQHWCTQSQVASGYVFEPQRKAAIGHYKLLLCKDGSRPHQAQLIVHPAYTWLYPQLFAQMAQLAQQFPPQSLELVSTDYQPEREEYLEKLGAQRSAHGLLMSRSVWHKLREAKPEGLQLSEVLQGLQSVPRTPIPTRMRWLKPQPPILPPPEISPPGSDSQPPSNGKASNLSEGS
jgi:hypothetical protein